MIFDIQATRCEWNNDKVKYCVLMCADDGDIEIVKAAAGALAMLTEVDIEYIVQQLESGRE